MSSFHGDQAAAADPAALPDRRDLALVAVERTRMPMVVTDPRREDNPIVLANRAFLELTGYTADEVIGRNCRFLQGPETNPADVDRLRRGIASSEHHVTVELLNYRKDGSSFWNQLCISPVKDDHGELLYHFASQQDVSDKHRVEEQKAVERLLLMEVDHRSLNALALVSGFVRLSRADTAQAYAAAVTGRVDALARAHRALAEAGWTGADLRSIVEAERPSKFGQQMGVEGPDVKLAAALVQPVTLILHELATNAVKHGVLARPEGRVKARWWQPSQDQLVLCWRETGGAAPQPALQAGGFGLQLIRGLVEQQLGGSTTIEWTGDGLDVHLAIPLGSSGQSLPAQGATSGSQSDAAKRQTA